MSDEYVTPEPPQPTAAAKYRLGTALVQVTTLRILIKQQKWRAAYVAADLLDVLLADPFLTAIRNPHDSTGRA